MSIGLNRFKEIIKKNGIKNVAKEIDVSISLLYQLNNGSYDPMSLKLMTVGKIKTVYGIKINDWLELTL